MSVAIMATSRRTQRRYSCPAPVIPSYLLSQSSGLDTVEEDGILHAEPKKKNHRKSFSSAPGKDVSDFALPGLEEEEADGRDFRQRSSSGGIKSLIKFRTRNKSGDSNKNSSENLPTDERQKGIKGFFDSISFRPRSKSDAASIKQDIRRKHHSGGTSAGGDSAAIQQMLNDNQQSHLGGLGELEPMQRGRSTSLGAKDRLKMAKERRYVGANNTSEKTALSRLISNGLSSHNQSKENGDTQEHQYTGQALIFETSEVNGDEANTEAILPRMEFIDIERDDPLIFNKFMRAHKCYDVIPTSSKLVVFDTSLNVKKAFYALVYNCVRAAPLWDQKKQEFVGMLTISDFIFILNKYYKSPQENEKFKEIMNELEEHQISSWRKELSHKYQPFMYITPEDSICEAVRRLKTAKVHRLPVIDPISGNAVFIITHKRILKFIHLFMKTLPKPKYMSQSLDELNLGTFNNIAAVSLSSTIIEALRLFVNRGISALPVLDENGRVVDIYAKFDVINLAAEKSYNNLDVTIGSALAYRENKEGVLCCKRTDSLSTVIEKIVKAGVHRLIVAGADDTLEGVVSLSDILSFLLQEETPIHSEFSQSCSMVASSKQMEVSPNSVKAK